MLFENKDKLPRFIVVYDKLTEPVAHAIVNKAEERSIECVAFSEQQFTSKPIPNSNMILLLNRNLIHNKILSDPQIKPQFLRSGVWYKKQGNIVGIYVDDEIVPITNKEIESFLDDKYKVVKPLYVLGWRCVEGLGYVIRALSKKNHNKELKTRLFKGVNKFIEEYIDKFVSGNL
jgi:hypothetical protein